MNLTRCAGAVLITGDPARSRGLGRRFAYLLRHSPEWATPSPRRSLAPLRHRGRSTETRDSRSCGADDDGSRRGVHRVESRGTRKGRHFLSGRDGHGSTSRSHKDRLHILSARSRFRSKHHVTLPTLLGHVMAHEIGHLLLPANSHSSKGLMRGDWGIAHVQDARSGKLAFTETETRLITRRLADTSHFFSSRINHDLANFQSRITVSLEMSSASAANGFLPL